MASKKVPRCKDKMVEIIDLADDDEKIRIAPVPRRVKLIVLNDDSDNGDRDSGIDDKSASDSGTDANSDSGGDNIPRIQIQTRKGVIVIPSDEAREMQAKYIQRQHPHRFGTDEASVVQEVITLLSDSEDSEDEDGSGYPKIEAFFVNNSIQSLSINRPLPKVGGTVIAPYKGCWIRGTVEHQDGQRNYRVSFEKGRGAEGDQVYHVTNLGHGRHPKTTLQEGPRNGMPLRVLCKVDNWRCANNCSATTEHFAPGVLLHCFWEAYKQPHLDSEYLVLFENGEMDKVSHGNIRQMISGDFKYFERKLEENKAMPEGSRLVRNFVDFPHHHREKFWVKWKGLGKGFVTTVWRLGKWEVGRVTELENDVAQVDFEVGTEWIRERIWSKSPRFYKIFEHRRYGAMKNVKKELHDLSLPLRCFEGVIRKKKMNKSCRKRIARLRKRLKVHRGSKCNARCAGTFVQSPLPDWRFRAWQSPLMFPLYYGWTEKVLGIRRIYTSPCGMTIRGYKDLLEYLLNTKSQCHVDWFCFDGRVSATNIFVPRNGHKKGIQKDISMGTEDIPIPCTSVVDPEEYPPKFEYAKDYVMGPGVEMEKDAEFVTCCECQDGCQDKEKCACWGLTIEWCKGMDPACAVPDGLKVKEVGYNERKMWSRQTTAIYECNEKCACRKEVCSNRVVQNGIRWPIQVFRTATKGWAVRALVDIPRGSFISKYSGKLLTEEGGEQEGKEGGDDYLLDLRYLQELGEQIKKPGYEDDVTDIEDEEKGEDKSRKRKSRAGDLGEEKKKRKLLFKETFPPNKKGRNFVINPKQVGNVGRFFSHSCDPNMMLQAVFVDSHDIRFPVEAFFTLRNILAGQELTWDYAYEIDDSLPEEKRLFCRCGSANCKGRLL